LEHNISVRQQDIQAQLAGITYKQSKLSQIPNLNFNTNVGVNTGRNIDPTTNLYSTNTTLYNSFGLQTNVEVFNFFSKRNTIAANKFEAEAAMAGVDKLRDDISLNVAGAYLQVLLNRQQYGISRIQLEQTGAQLETTRKLVRAGSVPELNAIQLEAQLAADSANVVSAKGAETQALLLLKALLNLDAGTPFDITTPPVELIPLEPITELQPEAVYQLALKNLPQQRVNELRLRGAEKNAAAAKGNLYPSVTAGANIQTNYSSFKNNLDITYDTVYNNIGIVKGTTDTVIAPARVARNIHAFSNPYGNQFSNNLGNGIGVTISVPIFNGWSARANVERAKLNVKGFQLQQQQDNLNLKQDIYKAYTDAVTSLETFNAATKAVEASEKALDFATKRYNIGLLNTLDLITTQTNVFRARVQRSLAQFDYVFKMKVLEFYKGQGLKL
jgi:outer membrane protein